MIIWQSFLIWKTSQAVGDLLVQEWREIQVGIRKQVSSQFIDLWLYHGAASICDLATPRCCNPRLVQLWTVWSDGIPNKALKLAFKPIPGLFVEFVQTLLVDSDLTDRKHSCDTDNRLREYIISVNRGAHGSGTERHWVDFNSILFHPKR